MSSLTYRPEVILKEYDEDGLVWAAMNASFSRRQETLMESLHELAGYSQSFLKKAKNWAWVHNRSSRNQDIMAQYSVMDTIHSEWLGRVDVQSLIQGALKPDKRLKAGQLAAYGLVPLRARDDYEVGHEPDWYSIDRATGVAYQIYMDAPTGFAIFYKGKPQAVAAVAINGQSELELYQIQGVNEKVYEQDLGGKWKEKKVTPPWGIEPFDWRQVLAEITGQLARYVRLDGVAIQAGAKNEWLKWHGVDPPHLTLEQAEAAYDQQADRLGFKRGEDKDWHLPLSAFPLRK